MTLDKEVRKKTLPTSESHTLVSEEARSSSKNKDTNKRDNSWGRLKFKKNLKHYYFDKIGHIKEDCWNLKNSPKPNVLVGALVGPDSNGSDANSISNFQQAEPTTVTAAAIVGLLAKLSA